MIYRKPTRNHASIICEWVKKICWYLLVKMRRILGTDSLQPATTCYRVLSALFAIFVYHSCIVLV